MAVTDYHFQLMKRSKSMSYFEYMMHKHLNGNDRFADLAKDMKDDYRFPKTDDYDEIYEYLVYERGT